MAWVTPPTFVVGAVLTAAQQNILSGDLQYLHDREIAYVELTSQVTISSTTESSGTLVLDLGSFAFDGTAVIFEFFAPNFASPAVSGGFMALSIFEGSTQIGRLGVIQSPAAAATSMSFFGRRKFTPSAASHDYKLTAFVSPSGSGLIGGLGGGTGTYLPAYARITRA